MASGKIIRSPKDRLHPADQFYTVSDPQLRGYMIAFANQIDFQARREVLAYYNDQKLASAYRAWRSYNDLHKKGFTDDKSLREIVRIPAGAVYEFLCAYFEPMYGKKWLQNKKALRHELVRPWWIVSKI